jgi:phage-related minor tail protein
VALEPAGISLQAEGLKKYIKNLDDIEKKQKAAFEAEFKGTGKSYAQVTAAAKKYEAELKQLANAEKRSQEESARFVAAQKKEADAINKTADAARKAAEEQRKAGRAQISGGVKSVFSGDIKGGVGDITAGLKAVGPAAAVATGGIAAVAVGVAAAGVAVGAVVVGVAKVPSETDRARRGIATSLGISATEAANKYNDAIQQIFIDNPQSQFAEIAEAITLTQRALDGLSPDAIEDISGQAILISQQFKQDLPKVVGAFEQSIEQLGLTGDQAADFITASLQRLPVDDAIDTINEYSGALSDMGFSGDEAFSLLLGGAQGSILGTDRAIDAINEFNVRFIEGGDEIEKSFDTLGLNFNQFRQAAEQGTGTAADAFKAFIGRAQEVDLSIASNRSAVNALGSQFESLSADTIKALDPDAIGFEDVAGSADKLNERFNNLGDAFTSVKRGALVALAPIGQTVLELANSIVPKIKAAFEAVRPAIEAFAARVVPAFQFGAEALGRLSKALGGAGSASSLFEKSLNAVAFVIEGIAGGIEILARVASTLNQVFSLARAGAAAFGSLISDVFSTTINNAGAVGKALLKLVQLDFAGAATAAKELEFFDIGASLDKAGAVAIEKLKGITATVAENPVIIPVEVGAAGDGALAGPGDLAASFDQQAEAIQVSEDALKSYQGTLQQAEQLQQSFAQSAEDTALKLARANEDIARKQAQSVAKLQERQAKDRDKLLKNQAKQLDKFEADRRKQLAKAEGDIRKARKEAADQRKRDQQKLQRELQQAQEKFSLSQLQSERRFSLSERRLRAEGDILALQQLREDRELERQEEKENFDVSQKDRVKSAEETQKEQAKDLDSQIKELKSNLEDQRAELLQSFDEQLASQVEAQQEAKAAQEIAFQEQAAERAIQLAREEEDRRISQGRQLEDLGRSLADQKDVTAEGTQAIASEIEKVFGTEGVADNIFSGFKTRTESDFKNLFENVEKIVSEAKVEPPKVTTPTSVSGDIIGSRIGGLQEFQEGGVVGGPIGSPQIIQAHAGETVLPTHQRSFQMVAPVVPSQVLTVEGGMDVRGSGFGQASEQVVQEAMTEMSETFRIAIGRLARRN